MDSGESESRAKLARFLNVSRARVTQVLNPLRQTPGPQNSIPKVSPEGTLLRNNALLRDGGDRRKLLRACDLRISESVKAVPKSIATHFELFKTELTAGEKSC